MTDALRVNRSVDRLEILHNTITDEDMTHLAEMLSSNKTLKESDCDITDNGFRHIMTICHTLTTNKTIERLVLSKKYSAKLEENIQDRLLFL